MTGRATFGDFLHAARERIQAATQPTTRRAGDMEIFGIARGLGRLVAVMGKLVGDSTVPFGNVPSRRRHVLNAWARAGVDAHEALGHAVRFLSQAEPGLHSHSRTASELERHLDAAAGSLSTGRDLLQTHFTLATDGTRQPRSEWALAVASPQVARALLLEIAPMARRIAPTGAELALSPNAREPSTTEVRRRLNAACQWLWVLNASVKAAQDREPVTATGTMLLHAIPVNVLPRRRILGTGDPVMALCEGVIGSAERVRHLAWRSAEQATWSPGMSATSLHQVAAVSTVVSHNCHVLLTSLAARVEPLGSGMADADLLAAADAAERARDIWRGVAGAVDRINTDSQRYVSPAAIEARDLVVWTGRLAYADQDWSAASGPAKAARLPENLVPDPEHARMVIAAVHHASHTLTHLARAEHEEVRAAAGAGRILVTTRSLPDDFDIPRPFAQAPQERVDALLARYRHAAAASREITATVAVVAEATQGPSRVLTAAEAAVEGSPYSQPREGMIGLDCAGQDDRLQTPELPGPLERAILDLGVHHPEILGRAAELDRASERLIMDAAQLEPPSKQPSMSEPTRSAAGAELINHALASGDARAVALLRHSAYAQREPPEREP